MKQASLSTDVEAKQKQVNNLRTEAHSCTTDAGTKDRNDFDEEGVPLFGSFDPKLSDLALSRLKEA
eukprot:CAMPEP_0198690512 /NCGR_PEP_ID=MMETSP1468-20131203/177354_1 /TAXON_ID=1461545 /ORGANISM="Mantoniella sp, Strain CCMP1436" /LENGTH=65 /DNA_ID=CAMNT_0044442797 /DNA_START=644 /DNA_END=841 /DNA_ORIENTATION=-